MWSICYLLKETGPPFRREELLRRVDRAPQMHAHLDLGIRLTEERGLCR